MMQTMIMIGRSRIKIEIVNRTTIRRVAMAQQSDTNSPMPKLLRILAGWSSA
jgi:hypothetical protein